MRTLFTQKTELRRRMLAVIAVLAGLGLAPTALAQVTTIKTSPGQNSDTFQIPVDIHVGSGPDVFVGDPLGWAGGILIMHILDATELDLDFLDAAPGFEGNRLGPPNSLFNTLANPFGPRSSNVQSSALSVNIFLPPTAGATSGISIPSSVSTQIARMIVHVKGSSPTGNSDVDLTAQLWNIWHAGTATLQLAASDRLWVTGGQTMITGLPVSVPGGLANSTGYWLHNPITQTLMVAPSVYLATLAGTVAIGIEHVPEPATGALLGLGVASFAASRALRRRRIRA